MSEQTDKQDLKEKPQESGKNQEQPQQQKQNKSAINPFLKNKKTKKGFATIAYDKISKKNNRLAGAEVSDEAGVGNKKSLKQFIKKTYKSVFHTVEDTLVEIKRRKIKWWSKLFFLFVTDFFTKVNKLEGKKVIDIKDLPKLEKDQYLLYYLDDFENYYDKRKKDTKQSSLTYAIINTFKLDIAVCIFFCVFHVAANLAKVYFLRELLIKLHPIEDSYGNMLWMFLTIIIDFFAKHQYQYNSGCLANKIRQAIAGLLYRKLLNLRTSESQNLSSGKIINILTVQMSSLERNFVTLFTSYMSPITFPLVIAGLYWIMDSVSAFIGTAYCLFVIILLKIMSKLSVKYRKLKTKNTDDRINITSEIMEEIRFAKMQGFEQEVKKEISKLREQEMNYFNYIKYLDAVCKALISSFKFVASFVTFVYYIYAEDKTLNKPLIFSAFLLLSFINYLTKLTYSGFIFNITMRSLFGRIISILDYQETDINFTSQLTVFHDEKDQDQDDINDEQNQDQVKLNINGEDNIKQVDKDKKNDDSLDIPSMSPKKEDNVANNIVVIAKKKYPVSFQNFRSAWVKNFWILNGINLNIEQGKLTMLVGRTACGKSTLLKSIIDEVPVRAGILKTKGKVIMVEQEPKIITGTIKDNIILDKEMDEERYKKILAICRLEKDVANIKDDTPLGERGSNLSWGQKQRICLARAAYYNADVYIFDDPFSVLDSMYSRKIFQDLMCEFLKGKTIIMATHILQFALNCDNIIILGDKLIDFYGTLEELKKEHGNLEDYFLKNNIVNKLKTQKEKQKQKVNNMLKNNRLFGQQIKDNKKKENTQFDENKFLNLFSKEDQKAEEIQEELKKQQEAEKQKQEQIFNNLLEQAGDLQENMDMQKDQQEMNNLLNEIEILQNNQELENISEEDQQDDDEDEEEEENDEDQLDNDNESVQYNKDSDDDDDSDNDQDDKEGKDISQQQLIDNDQQLSEKQIKSLKNLSQQKLKEQDSLKNNQEDETQDKKSESKQDNKEQLKTDQDQIHNDLQDIALDNPSSDQDKNNKLLQNSDINSNQNKNNINNNETNINQDSSDQIVRPQYKKLSQSSQKNMSFKGKYDSSNLKAMSLRHGKSTKEQSVIQEKKEEEYFEKFESSESVDPNFEIYKTYFRACGYEKVSIAFILFLSAELTAVVISRTYSYFAKTGEDLVYSIDSLVRFLIYFVSANFLISIIKTIWLAYTGRQGSIKLHNNMLQRVMMAKITFFMKTTIGNIMNRFSSDIAVADSPLPQTYYELLELTIKFSVYVIFVAITNYLIAVSGLVAGVLFYFIFKFCSKGIKQVGIIELISAGPINTIFGETLDSITTIRVYSIQNFFSQKVTEYLDVWGQSNLASWNANRFLQFYGDLISILFTCAGITFLVLIANEDNVGLISASIEMLLAVTDSIQYIFRHSISMNLMMTSVSRIKSYLETPLEGQLIQANDPQLMSQQWPMYGQLEFKNVWFRPNKDTSYKLRNMNFKITPGENIAVLGKSGTGKSTLFNLILRLFEVDKTKDSQILIDGVDTSTIGLGLLRRSITYIPQFPTLIEASLRKNMDPFGLHKDADIWDALKQFNLDKFVQKLPDQLDEFLNDHEVSVGKRQLIFFAKAYLHKTKLILFDEPSANFDIDTEQFLKQKVKEEFWEYTIVNIAHRLQTIADYDRVFILNNGEVEEQGSPYLLLVNNEQDKHITKNTGVFNKMIQKEGKEFANQFFKAAKFHYLENKQIAYRQNRAKMQSIAKVSGLRRSQNSVSVTKKNN